MDQVSDLSLADETWVHDTLRVVFWEESGLCPTSISLPFRALSTLYKGILFSAVGFPNVNKHR